jgi:hypothetical protein
MTSPFATAVDVELRWRPFTQAERDVADVLALDASDMIRSRWPDVDARITSASLTETSLIRVVAGMVKRAMISANSDGVESRTQAAGPFSISDKYANPTGSLYFTAEDIRLLDGDATSGGARNGWLA